MAYDRKKKRSRSHLRPDRKVLALRKRNRKKAERELMAKPLTQAQIEGLRQRGRAALAGKKTFTQKFGGGIRADLQRRGLLHPAKNYLVQAEALERLTTKKAR